METGYARRRHSGVKRINCTLRNGNPLNRPDRRRTRLVLIVPCGMETWNASSQVLNGQSINCTLRNGNRKLYIDCASSPTVLIVPYGM